MKREKERVLLVRLVGPELLQTRVHELDARTSLSVMRS
jgi:hypothetical protein